MVNMENVSNEVKVESIKAFQSAIRKSENALDNMSQKGANTTLLNKRLHALQVGLAVLETAWNQRPHNHAREELTEARNVLTGLLPSLKGMYDKAKAGSAQQTLIARRVKAFELAVEAIDDFNAK
jgi:hypothetical protein